MPREFPSIEALQDYAARKGVLYVGDWMSAFGHRRQLLSPEKYEVVNVRHHRGVRTALLVPKTALKSILKAEWERDPLRSTFGIEGRANTEKKRPK